MLSQLKHFSRLLTYHISYIVANAKVIFAHVTIMRNDKRMISDKSNECESSCLSIDNHEQTIVGNSLSVAVFTFVNFWWWAKILQHLKAAENLFFFTRTNKFSIFFYVRQRNLFGINMSKLRTFDNHINQQLPEQCNIIRFFFAHFATSTNQNVFIYSCGRSRRNSDARFIWCATFSSFSSSS